MRINIARLHKYNSHLICLSIAAITQHVAMIGKTGSGKSTLLENIARNFNDQGSGFFLLDPHGDMASSLKKQTPAIRVLSVSNPRSFTFNPLTVGKGQSPSYSCAMLLEAFRLYWSDAWGIRMEHILRNCLLTLMEVPGSDLSHINQLLVDDEFRGRCLEVIGNSVVKRFWLQEYEQWPKSLRLSVIAPIQNKVGALLADPVLRKIFCDDGEPLDFRKLMDEGKPLVIDLSKGHIGGDNAGLLGALLVSALGTAAYSRADIPEQERRPYYIIVDECQHFTTLAFANMLSELRKYGVGMILATQFLSQVQDQIKHAIFGNVATLICFRIGPADAPFLAREFAPAFKEQHLLNLSDHQIICKTLRDGRPTVPMKAVTLPPQRFGNPFLREEGNT